MRHRLLHLCSAAALAIAAVALGPTTAAQNAEIDVPRAGVSRVHKEDRKGPKRARPAWAAAADRRARQHAMRLKDRTGIEDATAELEFADAVEDEFGETHVRFRQVHNGVPVFGRQVVVQLDRSVGKDVFGEADPSARTVRTEPIISAADAMLFAKNDLGYTGTFQLAPTATLEILPAEYGDAKAARLVFHVEIIIDDGTEATAAHQYFVNAENGVIEWHYNPIGHATGVSQYSGTVSIPTTLALLSDGKTLYRMWDKTRGGIFTTDMRNTMDGTGTVQGALFSNATNYWGATSPYRDRAGVDAHFAVTKTWDYYRLKHGWSGLDGLGLGTVNRVHYGYRYNNAFMIPGTNKLSFGGGDGVSFGQWVTVDIAGHEYTHGVIDRTAKLVYANQSGALNESFADVFGTAVEFYTGIRPDYLIGEDNKTPGVAGDAMRSMSNPPRFGSPDHMSKFFRVATATKDNDWGWVHYNSGIPNKAFYLLAQGGVHPVSNIAVAGVGRPAAEWIFFRALRKLAPNATFLNARAATLSAAADGYGLYSAPWYEVRKAWDAVGVR